MATDTKQQPRPKLKFFQLPRKLTSDEKREVEAIKVENKQIRAQRKKLAAEADECERIISRTLEDLNICYRYAHVERDKWRPRVKRVSFRPQRFLTDEALYLPVDLGPGARPRGVAIEHLKDPSVLVDLSSNIGRRVDYLLRDEIGFVYVVYRMTGVRAIPSHVKYDDILALRPASADALSIPIGMTAGRQVMYRSFSQFISILVAGTIGGGKSNLIREALATLIANNSPRRLRIGLIDLKRGVELSAFEKLPHLIHFRFKGDDYPAMIDKREEVLPFLEWVIAEGEARLDKLREAGVVNVGKYNHKHPNHAFAHILIVIDEWADIKLTPKLGPAAQEALINVASRFRAAGISLLCCTQYPKSDVVPTRLSAVLPAKLCFAVPNIHASITVLNSARAHGLDSNAGRAIWQFGRDENEVQVPYINELKVAEVVTQAIDGKHYKVDASNMGRCDVTDDEIFGWAVRENAGRLDWRQMFGRFRDRGLTANAAREFPRKYSEQTVVVGSAVYRVERPTAIGKPWSMLPLIDDENERVAEKNLSGPDAPEVLDAAQFLPDAAQLAEIYTDGDDASTVSPDGDNAVEHAEEPGTGTDSQSWDTHSRHEPDSDDTDTDT